ncbi:UNVERIFIED_CONTAM: hypothetical protein Slati_1118600 [Sesamum latifolium]|uniref:Uncharacterized protein n=1 Tax=Sesamum latifolium TaxID=2727402 RepID=A0AAW2XBA3_9LAMI
MLNILKAFLKALEAGKPLWMNLLRSRWGSPLPPVRWGYRDRMSPSASSLGASTLDGVATRARANTATCSRIAAETI